MNSSIYLFAVLIDFGGEIFATDVKAFKDKQFSLLI